MEDVVSLAVAQAAAADVAAGPAESPAEDPAEDPGGPPVREAGSSARSKAEVRTQRVMGGSYRRAVPLPCGPVNRFPFDAVLFDLDGTLVATDRFWPDVARAATLEVFRERGVTRGIPGAAEWMAMVGLPLEQAFESTFGDLDPGTREALLVACAEAGHAQLDRHGATLLAGVEETLADLSARGVRLGIASNCSPEYLELMLTRAGLERWIEEGRCLASPGVRDKGDMIEDLLHTFGTRSAVMVGDRAGDRDAAWANGLPHVHIPRGYCGGGDDGVEAEAVLAGMEQLLPTCMARAEAVARCRSQLGGAQRIVVTGLPLAGSTSFATDLAASFTDVNAPALLVSGQESGRGGASAWAQGSGAPLIVDVHLDDADAALARADALVLVSAETEVLERRARGQRIGVAPLERLVEVLPGAQRHLDELHRSWDRCTVQVDSSNALSPGVR